nr:hypothetical protein [uncultured Campylobacter sp.]
MRRNFGFEILKFQSALGAFGYLFSQRRCGVPCGKTQANQRVILKFSARLGHCAAFKILNLCDYGRAFKRNPPLNLENFKIPKDFRFLKF